MCNRHALVFVGAVLGAGFASGKELISFFSRYGRWSWGLILVAVFAMSLLCYLCLRKAENASTEQWNGLYGGKHPSGQWAKGSVLFLDAVMGGAMISAAGHLAALAIPLNGAYLLGAVGTIGLAFLLGYSNAGPMAVLSGLLAGVHVVVTIAVMVFGKENQPISAAITVETVDGLSGLVGSIAYAALNLTLALGVICRCAGKSCRAAGRTAVLFGLWMTGLLFLSNYLFLKHPELNSSTFPMVSLLSRFGKTGYVLSISVMYLAILTTLSAVLVAMRIGLEQQLSRKAAGLATVCAPALLSVAGFEGLVERWYTPVGCLCLLLVFVPILKKSRKDFEKIS